MATNEVTIVVTGKNTTGTTVDAATKDMGKLGKSAQQAGQETQTGLNKGTQAAEGFGASLKRIGETAAGFLLADQIKEGAHKIVEGFRESIEAASSLGESLNAVQKIFGRNAQQVLDWGKNNAVAFGLSQRAFNEMAVPLGALLKNAGIDMSNVADQTIKLTKRAADMASVFNDDVVTVLEAVQAGLRGESDPLEKYGVSLNAAATQARALADSGKTNAAQLTAQDIALARLNIIYDQTATSAGDFADTTTGLANSQRVASAQMEEAKAKLGAGLLPVMATGAQIVGKLADGFAHLSNPVQTTIAVVLGLGAAVAVLAPRIVAAKTALAELGVTARVSAVMQNSMVIGLGKMVGALSLVSIGANLLGSALGEKLNPQLEAATAGLKEYADTGKLSGESARLFGDDAKKLDDALNAVTDNGFNKWLAGTIEDISGTGGVDDSFHKATERVQTFDTILADMVRNGQGKEALTLIADAAQRTGKSIDDVKKVLPQYAAAAELAARKTNDTSKAAHKAAGDMDDFGGTVASTATDVKELNDQLAKLLGGSLELEEAEDKAAQAAADLADQIKQQKSAGEAGAASLSGQTQAARDNRDAIRGLLQDYEDLIVAYQKHGRSTEKLRKQFEDAAAAAGLSRQEVKRYSDMLFGLPEVKATEVKVIGYETAVERVQRIQAEVQALTGKTIRIGVEGGHGGFMERAMGGISGAETGGQRGGMTIVGEHGREVVRLPYGSTVIPNQTTEAMLNGSLGGGGGGGGETRVVIELRGMPADELKRIREMVKVYGGGKTSVAFDTTR